MSFRKMISLVLGLLAISAILIGAHLLSNKPVKSAELHANQAPYGVDGPFQVGVRIQEASAKTPLEIMLWYPGLANTAANSISYDYVIKMQKPLGRVAIATYEGHAVMDAQCDHSMAPYPLVVLSPGFSIGATSYGWLAEHLASYGFVVISPDHLESLDPENELWQAAIARPHDILTVFDYVDEQTGAGGRFEGMIDPTLVAVAGHSYGGYTSLAAAGARIDTQSFLSQCEAAIESEEPGAWLCEKLLPHIDDMADLAGLDTVPDGLWPVRADARVDAIVPMAGNAFFFGPAGLSEIAMPVMAIGGTADADSPYMWGTHPTYLYASSKTKIKIALKDAEHMIFTAPCEKIIWYLKMFSGEFCADQSWDRTYAHELIQHFTTAFLLAVLKHDSDAAAVLAQGNIDFQGVDYQTEIENRSSNRYLEENSK
jgi:predicted dienelactone hydrolase